MSGQLTESAQIKVTLTAEETNAIQDSSGAPGRLSRKHFEAIERIVQARMAQAWNEGHHTPWASMAMAPGMRDEPAPNPYHDVVTPPGQADPS